MTNAPIVYRSGRHPLTVQSGVRFPVGVPVIPFPILNYPSRQGFATAVPMAKK
ncbi:MAG: hypothetical protein JWP26_2544 [Devosia sp.]|nr:hypothetical protein [Devosia sp.]